MTSPNRFLAVSPDIAARLIGRPRAFLAGFEYLKHVWFVVGRVKWWQILVSLAAFRLLGPLLGAVYAPLVPVLGINLFGFLVGPMAEEGVRLASLRTRAGILSLGAGFAVTFPLVEAGLFLTSFGALGILTRGLVALRLLGVLLHLYTHFVLAYRLSFFGSRGRATGSFVSAVCIHGGFNAATSLCLLLAYG